jgi:hypothetical protein
MSWFKRVPSPEMVEADEAIKKVQDQRSKRRRALDALVRALDEIPLDDGLVKIGDDMLRKEAD